VNKQATCERKRFFSIHDVLSLKNMCSK